jgi:5-methylcytosine-specific restriction endonuclease McrA
MSFTAVNTNTPLEALRVLVLNADYQPLSYHPLSVVPWYEGVKAVFRDSVDIVAEYGRTIKSPGIEMKVPSVIALKKYHPQNRTPALTRFNVFLRDEFYCQYCGDTFVTNDLTFDHVLPRSKGGTTNWENIVAACRDCNSRKGNHMPEHIRMFPLTEPRQPSVHELRNKGRKFPPHFLHESWEDFLYWDTELETEGNTQSSQRFEKIPALG